MTVETILIIQTIAVYLILIIFVAMLVVLKKEAENLKNEIEELKKQVKPTLDKAEKVVENINVAVEVGKKGLEAGLFAAEKVKDVSIMLENLCLNIKAGYDMATGKVSLFKLGVQKGLTAFVSHYLKNIKKKEEQK